MDNIINDIESTILESWTIQISDLCFYSTTANDKGSIPLKTPDSNSFNQNILQVLVILFKEKIKSYGNNTYEKKVH